MPSQEIAVLYQDAVLWTFTGYDSHGRATVGTPSAIKCRWVEKWKEVLDKEGNTIALDAEVVIWTPPAIPIGSILWLGLLSDWYGTGSTPPLPTLSNDLREIMVYNRTSDLKNRAVYYTYGVMRYKDQLPNMLGG